MLGRGPKGETIESFKGPRTGIYSFNLDFVRQSEIVEYGSSYTGISLQFGDWSPNLLSWSQRT